MKPLDVEVRDVLFVPGQPRIRKIFQRDPHGKITGFVDRRESWDLVWKKSTTKACEVSRAVNRDMWTRQATMSPRISNCPSVSY